MKTIGKRILAGICVLFFVLPLCICYPVGAADNKGTLALWCVKDTEIVEGMHWQIFRVGHRENDDYIFEGAFSEYRPTLGDKRKPMLEWDADTVASAGETLKVYAIVDKIPNNGEGYTNDEGNLTFKGLDDGLYLVVGDLLRKGTKTYIPSAIFFEMSGQEAATLNSYPKIVLETLDEQSADYSVKKVWVNDANQPPDLDVYITCEIYCDGVLKKTVRLDNTNDWTYKWSDKGGHMWLVKEKVIPKDYTVSYKDNHYQYLIVNTYDTPTDDSSVTDISTTTAPASTTAMDDMATDRQTTAISDSETTDVSQVNTTAQQQSRTTAQTVTTETVTTTVVTPPPPPPDNPNLPQTGQLWWPVPFLCGGGLTLIAAGAWIRKNDESS